jgi:hypothetical protein
LERSSHADALESPADGHKSKHLGCGDKVVDLHVALDGVSVICDGVSSDWLWGLLVVALVVVGVGVVGLGVDAPILVGEERECWIAGGHRLDADEMHKEYTRSASPTVTAWGYSGNDAVSSHTCDGSCELDRDDASGVAMRHGNVSNIVVVRVVERNVVLLDRIVIAATTADALGRERSRAILAHEIVTHFDCLS